MSDCKYYELLMESFTAQVGEDEYGYPIGEQEWYPVGEACHLKKTYDFDCDTCKEKG
jgi:hypothetical protein